ncbi:alpha/beta hydrolase [Actinoplanes sp. RD1]|uniref:alpha/beta hydrolase n=1 Tax=Actinoplanes sp. RD1 TaxID=3064538 RepID=UPI002741BEA3|nr:alpha/beta hydrolase [Actinoplanes sp. RD1]
MRPTSILLLSTVLLTASATAPPPPHPSPPCRRPGETALDTTSPAPAAPGASDDTTSPAPAVPGTFDATTSPTLVASGALDDALSPAAAPDAFAGKALPTIAAALVNKTSTAAAAADAWSGFGLSAGGSDRVGAAMVAAGEPYSSWVRAGRRFLAFDGGGTGRAVEVVGDLEDAERIAVLVPGVSTRLADFDRGLGGVAGRAPAVQARAVLAATHRADPRARVAVVAWLGYDPPAGLDLEAARDLRARAGADALSDFVRSLPRGAAVTMIGHSYGALVAGLAACRLARVHDIVALGAPGMGVRRATELGGVRVWSALAADDWIRRIPQLRLGHLGHGRRPSAPAFGAVPLPTTGVRGHDGYLAPGSPTLAAVADIVVGRVPAPAAS